VKRLLILWLTLLAILWLARSLLGFLPGSSSEPRWSALLAAALIPLLQALAVGWLTRSRSGPLPPAPEPGAPPPAAADSPEEPLEEKEIPPPDV
jgi:hypothetical protein